jgi:hypothetical protein
VSLPVPNARRLMKAVCRPAAGMDSIGHLQSGTQMQTRPAQAGTRGRAMRILALLLAAASEKRTLQARQTRKGRTDWGCTVLPQPGERQRGRNTRTLLPSSRHTNTHWRHRLPPAREDAIEHASPSSQSLVLGGLTEPGALWMLPRNRDPRTSTVGPPWELGYKSKVGTLAAPRVLAPR